MCLLSCTLQEPIRKTTRSWNSPQLRPHFLCKLLRCDLYSLGNRQAFFNFLYSQPTEPPQSPFLPLPWTTTKADKKKPETKDAFSCSKSKATSAELGTYSKHCSQVGLILINWLQHVASKTRETTNGCAHPFSRGLTWAKKGDTKGLTSKDVVGRVLRPCKNLLTRVLACERGGKQSSYRRKLQRVETTIPVMFWSFANP